MSIAQTIKAFTLWEFVKAHALTLKYFFKFVVGLWRGDERVGE